jgi:hypothetical protein
MMMNHHRFDCFSLITACCFAKTILMIYYYHPFFKDSETDKRNCNHYLSNKDFISEFFFLPVKLFAPPYLFSDLHLYFDLYHLRIFCIP